MRQRYILFVIEALEVAEGLFLYWALPLKVKPGSDWTVSSLCLDEVHAKI